MGPSCGKNNPELFIEICDQIFAQKNYTGVVEHYTHAIELSQECPQHLYFANRANAHFELGNFEECIADCDQAVNIDPSFNGSYHTKALALIE